MNKVILMGRLTADPDYRQTQQGIPVCKFAIAVDRPRVNGQKEADFINITAWRSTADFVSRYFNRGKPIIVEGSLRNDNYTDKNGIKRYEMHVDASNVYFTLNDSRANGNGGGYNNYPNQGNYNGGYQQGSYGNGGYQNGYDSNYGNQGGYSNDYYPPQQPQQPQAAQPAYQQSVSGNAPTVPDSASGNTNQTNDVQVGNLDDFEEILNDGEIPF